MEASAGMLRVRTELAQRTQMTVCDGRGVEKSEPSCTGGGGGEGAAALEKQSGTSSKVKHGVTIRPHSSTQQKGKHMFA